MRECDCGSGLPSQVIYDGRGIYLFRACLRCKREKLSHYRPDILQRYECDEQIEEDY